jgi:hypothetical protein
MTLNVVEGVLYTTEDIPLDIIFQNDSEEPVRILDVFDNPAAKRGFFNIVLKDAERSSIEIGGGWGRIDEIMKVRINLKDYQLPSERLKPGNVKSGVSPAKLQFRAHRSIIHRGRIRWQEKLELR